MTVFPLQANMTHGEVTPYVHARGDNQLYGSSLALARNVCVLRYGGVTRMPGTRYRGASKYAGKKHRYIPFEFNRDQVYSIEAGDQYFRFWTPLGRVESPPGTPVEVVTPYLEADLRYIQTRQSGDVIYIYCRGYQPRTLTRNSETSWALALYTPQDGPYLDINITATTLTPANTGHITPIMTTNTAPSGTVSTTSGATDAFELFDRDKTSFTEIDNASFGFARYRFAGGAQKVADAYWIVSTSAATEGERTPTAWEFVGSNDGTNWTTLDSRTNQTNWSNSEVRYFEFNNVVGYEYYGFDFRGGGLERTQLAEIAIHQAAADQTPFNLTASSTAGINGGTGFVTSDVGRPIRLLGGDGIWRWAEIVSRVSSTVVTIRLHGHALPDLSPIVNWRLGAWSTTTGWPSSLEITEDRLVSARTDTDPLGVWGSVSADYDNFRSSTPAVDDDGFAVRLTGGKLNDISWLNGGSNLLAGTAGSLRAIGRNNPNNALSASNIKQRAETLTPSARSEPINIENVVLFLDYYEQRIYEAIYSYEVEGYVAKEVSSLNEHLFSAGVSKIVYLSHPHKIIICLRQDGKLIAFTYDREQQVVGATLCDVGGVVEDAEQLSGTTGTDLWLAMRRTVNGSTVRYVETLAEFWRSEFTAQDVPIYGASALVYDGAATNEVTGAGHLIGETVGLWADGRDIGDAEVAPDGSITLPGSVEAEQVVAALRMPWAVQTLRLTQIGNRDGSGLGRKAVIVKGMVDLYESAGVSIGTLVEVLPMTFEDEVEQHPDDPVPLRTGMFGIPVEDSWKNNGVLVLSGDRMYPVTIRAIQLEVDGEP